MFDDILLTPVIAFWLRSSVVSVLFSLISERVLLGLNRDYSYFCTSVAHPLGLPMIASTVSLVLHCLQVTRNSFHCYL
ncbi:hypothetical protein F4804DRAFT_303216 [Jackrogersella minutella]|nr:hypothetical protein F4804DRAFT_303216 [Jackrogersella minutella]